MVGMMPLVSGGVKGVRAAQRYGLIKQSKRYNFV